MTQIVSRRKKYRPKTKFSRESTTDSLDFDFDGNDFFDDELLTLDEFESLNSSPRVAETEKPSTNRRIDPPSTPPRQKVARRRQIDPTTCEREYNTDEIEFMSALDDYKRNSGRMFPTCSEILEVLKGLGYEKSIQPPVSEVTEIAVLQEP